MKRIVIVAVALLLFVGCSAETGNVAPETNSIKSEPGTQEATLLQKESQAAVPTENPFGYNKTTEKYYDYFSANNYVSMLLSNETKGEGFSDAEMAAYALSELILQNNDTYEQAVGFPKEDIDAVTEKYFGAVIQTYKNKTSTVIPGTGNITATGWGGSSVVFILKELATNSDGISTGVFYQFNFGMEGLRPTTKDDLLQGKFEDYGQPFLVTIVFEEKADESGELYLRYYKLKSEGEAKLPYEIYQGEWQ